MFDALDNIVKFEDLAQFLELLRSIFWLPPILDQSFYFLYFFADLASLPQTFLAFCFTVRLFVNWILLQEGVHAEDFGALLHMFKCIIYCFHEETKVRFRLGDCVIYFVVICQENLLLFAEVIHEDQGFFFLGLLCSWSHTLFISWSLGPI